MGKAFAILRGRILHGMRGAPAPPFGDAIISAVQGNEENLFVADRFVSLDRRLSVVRSGRLLIVSSTSAPSEYTFTVVRVFPHDTSAYTQGLAYRDGFLYEGTGRNGQSSLRKVRLETGEVVQRVNLGTEFFGEGITIVKDQVFQLTWKSGVGFVYDVNDFRLLRKFSYAGEGWGLATNGRELFLSDGTAEIRVLDPETFQEKRRLKVHDGSTAVDQLNELEFVDGQIFANVWHTNRIARISPQTGDDRRVDRPHRTAQLRLSSRTRGRAQRHRVRSGWETAVCHGETVAQRV